MDNYAQAIPLSRLVLADPRLPGPPGHHGRAVVNRDHYICVRQAEPLQGTEDSRNVLGVEGVTARAVANGVDSLIGPQHETPPAGIALVLWPPCRAGKPDVTPAVDLRSLGKDSAATAISAEFKNADGLPRDARLEFTAKPGDSFVAHLASRIGRPRRPGCYFQQIEEPG